MEQIIKKLYALFLASGQKISTDSRKIEKGQIFFALKGPNFDGNLHAENALALGARYAIVDDNALENNKSCILVDDVLITLQNLALHHRRTLNTPIIAITGSNGKTTTKELVKEVLSRKYKVAFTKGNLNNHIGVPLTLLDIKAYEDIAIVEMGANHIGEIASYCSYTEPNYGLITNIGKAHLEGFGGIEGVIKGKTELYKYLELNNGLVFVDADDNILIENLNQNRKHEYNTREAKVLTDLESEFLTIELGLYDQVLKTQTNLTGEYNLPNIVAACKIGEFFEVPIHDIQTAIEQYQPTNSRSQILKKDQLTIILDAYNANPSSMEVGLRNLAKNHKKKIAILGAMKEMGDFSLKEHQKLIDLCLDLKIDQVVLVGIEFQLCQKPDFFIYFETNIQAQSWFKSQTWTDEIILLKGSRGIALEKILE